MVQDSSPLPEGTDTIVDGALETGDDQSPGAGTSIETPDFSENDSLIIDPAETGTAAGLDNERGSRSGSTGTWAEKLRGSTENLTGQASGKARDLVGQGIERGSEALANMARMIGDTATGLDERLGEDYGNYARRAAASIENAANGLASKDADVLIDDTREFIRKSPGIALAGAAIVGFALARLVKNGLATEDESDPSRSAD